MPRVVVFHDLPIAARLRAERPALDVVAVDDHDAALAALPDADALVTNPPGWDDAYLAALDPGDWVQSTSAGYAAYPVERLADAGVHFTAAGGLNAPTVAEHALAMALAFTRRLSEYRDRQRERRYDRTDSDRLGDLAGDTMTVVGLGNIGEAIARRARAFGMTVEGLKRDPTDYDGVLDPAHVHGADALHGLLPATDYLVLAVPLTEATRGLVDADVLAALPETAHLINVARGAIVDQDALVDALETGTIAGAGLDVFDPEPLPADSPLWDRDDVVLTPHIAGRSASFVPRFVELFGENFERLGAGEPLLNAPVPVG